MKRQDGALNPARVRAVTTPTRVCGAPLPGGGSCSRASADGQPCADHGGRREEPGPASLPEGFKLHKVFKQEDRQAELDRYVGRILVEYGLNQSADLRQVLLSGIAYVRLLFEGATMDPRELDYLSRVVDRHLRNLRATPKEQAATKGDGASGADPQGLLPSGQQPSAILERVRLSLTAGQVQDLVSGRGLKSGAKAVAEAGEAEELFPEPGRTVPDPDLEIDPFGD